MTSSIKYKNILIIGAEVQPIPPVEGGAVELLVEHLIKENDINKFANLTIISPYAKNAEKESKKFKNTSFYFIKNLNSFYAKAINFVDLFCRRFFNFSSGNFYIHKICRSLMFECYDLIIVENRPLFGKIIRKYYNGALFLHLHNDFINKQTKMLQAIINSYDKFLVISNYLKSRLLEIQKLNVEVIYNGIDLNLFSKQNKPCLTKMKIIYAGRIVQEKGVLELIKAYKLLNRKNTELIILGDFDSNATNEIEYRNRIFSEISNSNSIKILGYINNKEINKFYSEGYIGVVPSIVNEALSLTAIEMLSSGLPVICTNAGGLIEVVDSSCGSVIERNNIVENLSKELDYYLNNINIRNKKSKNAINKSHMFSLDRYIKSFINSLN